MRVVKELSDNSLISFVAWNLATVYAQKGDLAQAIEHGKLAVEKATTHGDKAWAQRTLGWVLCKFGDTERGIGLLTEVLSVFRAGGFMPVRNPYTLLPR